MYEIIWKGNEHTNSSSRQGYIPFVIVNHISAGSMSSMDSWFTSPDNLVSSAHFGISKDGRIHQYVDVKRMSWANGSSKNNYPKNFAHVLLDMNHANCNLYSVSIEHEGTDGELTEDQFQASVWLHSYIRKQIMEIWGEDKWFPFDEYHVLGHFQIHKGKPLCPGLKFPWERLYAELSRFNNKEDDDDMNKILDYPDWVWDELDKYVGDAYNDNTIEDWYWVQKIRDKQLTYSELLLLKILIDERRRNKGLES